MTREQRLDFLIDRLKGESPQYARLSIPGSIGEKQKLLRALMNVRAPKPVERDWLDLQDKELREQATDKGIVDITTLPRKGRYILWQGDITRLNADAIVNAANSQMLGCFVPLHGCIDNAIHSAAGIQLRLACDRLMHHKRFPQPAGEAVITPAFNLPSKFVIHTVGPIVYTARPTADDRRMLESCYRSCLKCAEAIADRTISFAEDMRSVITRLSKRGH